MMAIVIAAVALAPGDAHAADPEFAAGTPDGEKLVFEASDALTPDDHDRWLDIYSWSDGATTLVSQGPQSDPYGFRWDARFWDLLGAEGRILFSTGEPILPPETRYGGHYYESSAGSLTQRDSAGRYLEQSADGSRTFVETEASLVPEDQDGSYRDIYEQTPEGVALVSSRPTGSDGRETANLVDVSEDGLTVLFSTAESLVAADQDVCDTGGVQPRGCSDLYVRSGDDLQLVSAGPGGDGDGFHASSGDLAADGSAASFRTGEPLVSADEDDFGLDAYIWRPGEEVELISGSVSNATGVEVEIPEVSDDLSRIYLQSAEQLTPDDTDHAVDVFRWTSTGIERLSTGPSGGNSEDDVQQMDAAQTMPPRWWRSRPPNLW